jgi:hypothetical protein
MKIHNFGDYLLAGGSNFIIIWEVKNTKDQQQYYLPSKDLTQVGIASIENMACIVTCFSNASIVFWNFPSLTERYRFLFDTNSLAEHRFALSQNNSLLTFSSG